MMTQVSEATERGSQGLPTQSRLRWGLTAAKLMLRNPSAIKKLLVMGSDEPRYVRPLRPYDPPSTATA